MNHRRTARLLLPIFSAVAYLIAPTISPAAPAPAAPGSIDFNRDVRPILSDNCFACHGPDKNKRKADLRLDTKDGLFTEIDDVFPVVPGKPAESDVFRRITTEDVEDRMPPAKGTKRLTPVQVATLKRWIEQGAPFKGHWAYLPPVKATAPADASHPVGSVIDHFIRARLSEAGLAPAAPADKTTLIRRAYFDVLGLPPSPAEVDAFVTDTRLDAWARVIDGLLARPGYGERMAMLWFDQVRYADTIGYHSDNPRDITPYRDWVIDAFNRNERFDEFTIEQIAGDLLPNSTLQQKVASGYNRLLQTTEEGGAQPKEYAAKYLSDRVRNLSTVWLGSSMGCCECHDHKFDPFTMRDFYQMEAFFADVREAPVGRREAGIPVPLPAQAEQLHQLDATIADVEKRLREPAAEIQAQLAAAQAEWEKTASAEQQTAAHWTVIQPKVLKATGGTELTRQTDGSITATGKNPAKETFTLTATVPLKGITALQLEVFPDATLGGRGPGRSDNGNFVLTEFKISYAKSADKEALKSATPVAFKSAVADHSQTDFAIASAIDGKPETGWAILPEVGKPHWAAFISAAPIGNADATTVAISIEQQSMFAAHTIGRFRLSATNHANPAAVVPVPTKLKTTLAIAADKRTAEQKAEITFYYRSIAPLLDPMRAQLATAVGTRDGLLKGMRRSLVTVAQAPKPVRVLARGNWLDDTGEIVEPAIPQFLGKLNTAGKRPTRLDLARWLVSRENPLVARVFVNRLWKQFYGRGLSAKLDDLGSQGEWPTHPELLDSLAVEFIESGWDIKQMIRQIMLSESYQQSSRPAPQLAERDPANLLIARQGRFRLDAEIVRDNALAVSDLLVNKLGGESVKPYQPEGYWTFLNFPTRTWVADKGESLYRRGIYTWWQRTFLHPSLLAFDAPTREEAVCERTRSNVPQQALTLLNDPIYVEAARVFAEHIVKDGGSTTADRLAWAYRKALSRAPRPEEMTVLEGLLAKHQQQYASEPAAASALLASSGEAPAAKDVNPVELAAWTSVARTILNLHETITRN